MQFIPQFPDNVVDLEKSSRWREAAILLYQQWCAEPQNVTYLLCAGLELWYTLVVLQHENMRNMFNPKHVLVTDDLQEMLAEVAKHGEEYFSTNTMYNCYFGYMIKTMPYFFGDFDGEYDRRVEIGESMIQKAYRLDPSNLLAKAFSFNTDEYGRNSPFYEACRELWSVSTQRWGDSAVQRYFFDILWGEDFMV